MKVQMTCLCLFYILAFHACFAQIYKNFTQISFDSQSNSYELEILYNKNVFFKSYMKKFS